VAGVTTATIFQVVAAPSHLAYIKGTPVKKLVWQDNSWNENRFEILAFGKKWVGPYPGQYVDTQSFAQVPANQSFWYNTTDPYISLLKVRACNDSACSAWASLTVTDDGP
jgi:hypothetical protein